MFSCKVPVLSFFFTVSWLEHAHFFAEGSPTELRCLGHETKPMVFSHRSSAKLSFAKAKPSSLLFFLSAAKGKNSDDYSRGRG